jgi:riboflavin synthase
MFTGIIEEMGVVKSAVKTVSGHTLTILAKTVLEGLSIGDSMTVNGACLTVVHFDATLFQVDVSPETGRVTTLGGVKAGEPVNLERAMRLNDRLGGHLVTGHVDGVGTIRSRTPDGQSLQVVIEASGEVLRYCVPKGAITVDGISLTINEVDAKGFRVTIIPHTANVTTLGAKQVGAAVNLESDLIGKYVDRLLQEREGAAKPDIRIDKDYLARRGLI